jgi:hypothetical protein
LGGAALSLKAPALPVYWGLNLKIGSDYFSAGATGDFYFLDGLLIPIKGNDGFGYFIGVGGYLGFGRWRGGSYSWQGRNYNYGRTSLGLGARIPVGLNVVIPVSKIKFEAFLDVVPSLGLDFFFWDRDYIDRVGNRDVVGFGFNIGGEFGIRVWF